MHEQDQYYVNYTDLVERQFQDDTPIEGGPESTSHEPNSPSHNLSDLIPLSHTDLLSLSTQNMIFFRTALSCIQTVPFSVAGILDLL